MNTKTDKIELKNYYEKYGPNFCGSDLSELVESYKDNEVASISIDKDSIIINNKGERTCFYLFILIPLFIFVSIIIFINQSNDSFRNYIVIISTFFFIIMSFRVLKEKAIYGKNTIINVAENTIKLYINDPFLNKYSFFNNFHELSNNEHNFCVIEEFFRDNHINFHHEPLEYIYTVKFRVKSNGVLTICLTDSKKFGDDLSKLLNKLIKENTQ